MPTFDDDLNACAGLVERGDPDRFAATMAAPVAVRQVLFPLYAFNVEVARAPWVTQEPTIAEMRLQWWRDALQEIAEGGLVRRHDVVTPLATVVEPGDTAILDRLVLARRWDIYREPFADEAEFRAYLEDTAGGLLQVALRSLGDPRDDLARKVGHAQGLAAFLCAVPRLVSLGRRPLFDARDEAIAQLATTALADLRTARREARSVTPKARAALLGAWQAEPILKRAAARPDRVAKGDLGLSEAHRRGRLLWLAMTGRW